MFSYIVLSGESSKLEEIFTKIHKIVSGKASDAKSCPLRTLLVNSPFVISKMSSQRLWAYFAFSDNKKDLETLIKQNNRGLCIVNGSDKSINTSEYLNWLSSHSIDEVSGVFDGCFSCVSITKKNGFSAFCDFSGKKPVFYASKNGVNFVSNVPNLLSCAVNDSLDYDYLSLSWIITTGRIFFDRSLYCNVNKLNSLKYIETSIGSSLSFSLVPFKNTIFTQDNVPSSDLTEDEWDLIHYKLVKNAEKYVESLPSSKIILSGNKDSRLLLSLVMSTSLKNEVEICSDRSNHDYLVDFCSAIGMSNFKSAPVDISDKYVFDKSCDLLKLCQYFIKSLNAQNSSISESNDCFLSSLGGELYRGIGWINEQQFTTSDFDNIENNFYMKFINYFQSFDKLRILSDYYRLTQIEQVASWLTENISQRQNNFPPEKFYLQNILGNTCLINSLCNENSVFPLLSFEVAKRYFKLSLSERSKDLLHFNCMYRSNPKLCEYPFKNDSWNPCLNGYKNGINFKNSKTVYKEECTEHMIFLKHILNNKEQAIQILDDAQRASNIDSLISIDKFKRQIISSDLSKVDILPILRVIAVCTILGDSGLSTDLF